MIYKKTIPWSSSSNNKPGEPSGLNAVPQMMVTKIRNTYGGKNPQHRKKNLQEKNMKKVSSAKGPNLKLRGSDEYNHNKVSKMTKCTNKAPSLLNQMTRFSLVHGMN